MKSEPLSKVAPSKSSDRRISPDSVLWHLNLDQIVSGSGTILNRMQAPLKEAGTSTFIFDERNVLYSKLRPYLNKVVCPDSVGVATTELVPLRPDPKKLDRNYLCYYLRSPAFVSWVSSQVAGAKMPRVNMKAFWAHEIPLPPLQDQIRIAHLLSKVEGLIDQRKQHLQQLDDLLKSVFLNMFGDPVTNIKDLPVCELGKFITHLTSGGRSWAKFYSTNGKRFIRSLDVQMNSIGTDDVVYVNPPVNQETERTKVRSGDVLLTITGSKVGRVCFVPDGFEESYVSQHVAIVRTENINPIYLSYYLSMPECGQRTIKKKQYGQAKPGINLEQIRMFPILEPKLTHQNRFALAVKTVDALKCRYLESVETIQSLYAILSQQAFKGELDLTRVILAKGSNAFPSTDTTDPMIEPIEQAPFELPTPPMPFHKDAYRARELALNQWLVAYTNHHQDQPFSADDFLNLVQQKLSAIEEHTDAEWVSELVGANDYEQVKAWVFQNLKGKKLRQKYDDKKNRVRVSAIKE